MNAVRMPIRARKLEPGEKIARVMLELAEQFALAYGVDPEFAYLRTLPPNVQEGLEYHGIMLIQHDSIPAGWLAIARGGMSSINLEQKTWRKK